MQKALPLDSPPWNIACCLPGLSHLTPAPEGMHVGPFSLPTTLSHGQSTFVRRNLLLSY